MDRKDFRSLLSKLSGTSRTNRRHAADRRSVLLATVGRAMGVNAREGANFEPLEGRSMLEGSFANSILLTPDGTGHVVSTPASGPGANNIIPGGVTDNDFFRFVAPANDFVTILADTANESPASTLNTRVQVFNSSQVLVASGTNNGQLTSGFATDGWAGFVAQAGQTYFVVVSSENGAGTPGTYSLRIAALSTAVDIGSDIPETGVGREHGSPIPDATAIPPIPITPILGQLGGPGLPVTSRTRQDNIVYKLVLPSGGQWDNLITIDAQSNRPAGSSQATSTRLDTRLDIYNALGQLVATDSDAGRINDAFTTVRAKPGDIFYIRVRSDEVRNANIQLTTGPFWLVLDAIADKIAVDPVTRRGSDPGGAFVSFGPPTIPPVPTMASPTFQSALYEFTAQGTGLAIITQRPTGLDPVVDGALRLIDDTGALVAFNDNFGGADPQITANLIGGKRYFVIVDGFDLTNGTQFGLFIEANHTINNTGTPIDDHVNTPALPQNPTQAQLDAARRQFELATGLPWSPSFATFDADNNLQRDLGLRVAATGTGRIQGAGDTDLFQFTPQIDLNQTYAGNNDDNGRALFAGGAFEVADPNNPWPTNSRDLAIWDAQDWWFTGAQFTDPTSGVQFGFQDNPATAGTSRAEIYALADWDPSNGGPPPGPGLTNHVLVVGGDFNLVVPTPLGPVTLTNLALWVQDPQTGRFVWDTVDDFSTDGAVRALKTYDPVAFDPDGSGPLPTVADPNGGTNPDLYAGGDFTTIAGVGANHIGFFRAGGWNPMAAGTNGPVFALEVYDAVDPGGLRAWQAAQPGPPPVPEMRFVNDTPDKPSSLYVGGQFTQAGGAAHGNLATWDGVGWGAAASGRIGAIAGNPGTPPAVPPFGGNEPAGNINGPVFAMTVYDAPDPDGVGPLVDPGPELYIGGQFTNAGGQAANNIAHFGAIPTIAGDPRTPLQDPAAPLYAPQLIWQALGAGTDGPVLALTVWDPADINNGTIDPFLVLGGSFTNPAPNIAISNGAAFFDIGGADGAVRALTVVLDDQEPGIQANLDSGTQTGNTAQAGSREGVLYAGGDFQTVNVTGLVPVAANHVAQFAANTGPLNPDDFFEWTALAGGVDNNDPTTPPTASVFALTGFDDGNPFEWDRHDRPAEQLQLVVSPVDGAFLNTRVRVFDSNFNVVYNFNRPGSETIAPPFPDPSGMLDPNINPPPLNTNLAGNFPLGVWGGETYYIEISGQGTGRYSFTLTAAAQATDLNGDGTLDDVNAQLVDEPDEGHFADAPKIETNLPTGDADNTVNSATDPGRPLPAGHVQRVQHITPSLNQTFTEGMDLGNISTIDDTDLYFFRAEFTGTAEIRVQTIDIPDQFGEMLVDQGGNDVGFNGLAKTYTSHLDAALRIFRNDFEQIAYQDDNLAIAGERQDDSAGFAAGTNADGTPTRVQFTRKDPRIVINVVAGNNYFIQVESGQKYKIGAPKLIGDRTANINREIDQRFVNGSYRLLVNQMPQQNAEIINGQPVLDDHTNIITAGGILSNGFATVIPIGDDPTNTATNGIGSINGVIRDTPNNPADQDIFTYIAPGSGNMTVRVSRTGTGNTLNPTLDIFLFSHQTGQFTLVAQGAPVGAGIVSATLGALAGDTYLIGITGSGGSQGAYRIDITGVPALDDTADFAKFFNARDIPTHDFQGQGTLDGSLETRGDTDIFRFSVADFALFNISVHSHSATLNPALTIYEVSESPSGDPIFLRIGVNDGTTAGGTSTVTVPVTPNRTTVVPPPGQNRTYPYYYVLVRGANPNTDFGSYTVTLDFPPSDDHPDAPSNGATTVDTSEFPFASSIPLDPLTGQGNAVGNIEINTDSDLFVYTAPAGGSSTVVISRPTGSTLRYKVSIADANGNVLASGIAADDPVFFTATASTTVLRGVDYFIVVEPFNDPLNPNVNSTDTGQFTVSVTAPPVDDYPNAGEFQLASTIPIDFNTGKGQLGANAGDDPSNPRLSPANDTDLFTFTTPRAGNQIIRITPWDTAVGHFAPRLTLFDAQGNQISTVVATSPLQEVSFTITNAPANTKYFVLVSADGGVAGSTLTGEYRIQVDGPGNGGGGGGGGNVDSIDFNNPTVLTLDGRTGDGAATDLINVVGDRDLFTFTTTAAGKVFVQLTAPNGSLLRASIRVLNAANELQASEVAFDSDGIPGAIANVTFQGLAGRQYWVVVDGLGDSTGSYTLKVNTQPLVNMLVFPEGFATNNIREFVSIINPGNLTATFTVFLRYETGALETQVMTATIAPHSRSGLTIIDGTSYQTPGIRLNAPYSVVLQSDQPLGATMAHYDFGHAIGDSLTETVSPTWNFARVEKTPGSVLDFIVFYNINNFDVNATLTAYDSAGQPHSLSRTFGALRRGGFSINDIGNFPLGVFGATLTVKKASDGTDASVVASLSHYSTTGDAAFGLLGDPSGGSKNGIITNLAQGSQLNSEIDFFNPGDSPATITLTGSYIRTSSLPQFVRNFTVAAKGQLKITGTSLGLSPDQPIGIRYSSDQSIVAASDQVQLGDADSTQPATTAGTQAFFGDAFIDTRAAGVKYFETVWLANPTSVSSTINVKLDFLDGTSAIIPVTVAAHGFAELKLHTRPEILSTHTGPTWFAVDISSANPFVASMTHYDLALGGGWATSGVPFGILMPLTAIS